MSIKELYCYNCLYDEKLRPTSHRNCKYLKYKLNQLLISNGNEFTKIIDKVDLSNEKKHRLAIAFFDAFTFYNGSINFKIGNISEKILGEQHNEIAEELERLDTYTAYKKVNTAYEKIKREELNNISNRHPDVIEKERKFIKIQNKKFKTQFKIEKEENKTKKTNPYDYKEIKEEYINNFVNIIISGSKDLLERGDKETCIYYLKQREKNESDWRDWFSEYFQRFEYIVLGEPKQGEKILDLKLKEKISKREYKIEFKLWYNPDKKEVVEQVNKYLTDFDKQGYIIMINDTKNEIDNKYKEMITKNSKMEYVKETWLPIKSENNDYVFYKSIHKFDAKEKEIYHFILNPFKK